MHRHIFAKLKSKIGESLGETLVALLIAAMSMLIMAGAIVSTAKANDAARKVKPFTSDRLGDEQVIGVTFGDATSTIEVKVSEHDEEGADKNTRSVYYYEAK
ncbi:MAG: hypothetical protein K6G06_06515 [Butyrivibrio sp.]|nr:hypothetical protein [Butyrivibrio sp.]